LKKLRFALAGCGEVADKHAAAISALEECELAAVYDCGQKIAGDFAQRYAVKAYSDYQKLLQESGADVVSICSPSCFHAAMGITAAGAGKHVLVEKPMALSLEDADALIKACASAGVKLGVVHQNRFTPAVLKLRKAMEEGLFGKVTHANATVRWNRSKEYYDRKPWRRSTGMGGGVLLNQAIHNIDLLQWIMGRVISVFGYTASCLKRTADEDVGIAVLRFESGALGVIEAASTIYPKNLEETISVFGERGTVIIGGSSIGDIRIWKFDSQLSEDNSGGGNQHSGAGAPTHLSSIRDMAEAVITRRKPLVDGREGRKALEIILAIHESCADGKEVMLPMEITRKPITPESSR
jgi:predicted dehydrogenase